MSEKTQWQLSGSAPEVYERSLVPVIFAPWAAVLIERAALRPSERVLDVACGTGIVARLATPQVGPQGQVTGLDLNPGMLAEARALPSGSGAAIDWREGSAVALPFADATFDVVFCQQGLQFFPDRGAALREMRRVLVPGGRLALAVWRSNQHHPFFGALADTLARYVSPEAGAGARAPLGARHRGGSTPPWSRPRGLKSIRAPGLRDAKGRQRGEIVSGAVARATREAVHPDGAKGTRALGPTAAGTLHPCERLRGWSRSMPTRLAAWVPGVAGASPAAGAAECS